MVTSPDSRLAASSSTRAFTLFLTKKGILDRASFASLVHLIAKHRTSSKFSKGSLKSKFAILSVEAPVWQGAKVQEYQDISNFRNAVRRDASALKM
jgi:hypothetical protein